MPHPGIVDHGCVAINIKNGHRSGKVARHADFAPFNKRASASFMAETFSLMIDQSCSQRHTIEKQSIRNRPVSNPEADAETTRDFPGHEGIYPAPTELKAA
jgi:hypothetical protein